jgi:hypothetical protein
MKYNENVKYSTKNNMIHERSVFFETTNHASAMKSSAINFTLMAVNVCIVLSRGSFETPLKKIMRPPVEAMANETERLKRLIVSNPSEYFEPVKRAAQNSNRKIISRIARYFRLFFIT